MIKRTVVIATDDTHVYTRDRALVVEPTGGVAGRVPCEDLGVLLLESHRVTITHSALAAAAEAGASVLVCGRDHVPVGLMLPLAGNTLHTQRLAVQLNASLPTKKRAWQQIVTAKIVMQAATLPLDSDARPRLRTLAAEVRSGDPDNREAQAARFYWPALFRDPLFRRARDGPAPNALLNYGYIALRAAMARAICATGLHPALGLHHHHRENAFALADDLIEPYRPFVDAKVCELVEARKTALDRETKGRLLAVLSDQITLEEEKSPVMVAMQRTAASLVRVLAGETQTLDLPRP